MSKRDAQQKQIIERKKSEKKAKAQYLQHLQHIGHNAIKLQNRNPDVFVAAFNVQLSKESARTIVCSRCTRRANEAQIQTRQQVMDVVSTPQRAQFQKDIIAATYANDFFKFKRALGPGAPILNKMRRETLENFYEWAKSQCALYVKNRVQPVLVDALQRGIRLLIGDELRSTVAQIVEQLAKIRDLNTSPALAVVKGLGIPEPWQKDAVDLLRLQAGEQKSNWLNKLSKKSCNLSNELYKLHQEQLRKEEDCKNCENRQETLNKEYKKFKMSHPAIAANMATVDWTLMPLSDASISTLNWELLLVMLNNMILKAEVAHEIRKGLIQFIEKLIRAPESFSWNAALRNAQNRRVTSLTLSLLAEPWGSWEDVYSQLLDAVKSDRRNLWGDSKLLDALRDVKRRIEDKALLCGAAPKPAPAALNRSNSHALLAGSARVQQKPAVEYGDEPQRKSGSEKLAWPKLWKNRAPKHEEHKPLLAVVESGESQSGNYKPSGVV